MAKDTASFLCFYPISLQQSVVLKKKPGQPFLKRRVLMYRKVVRACFLQNERGKEKVKESELPLPMIPQEKT